jgi:hypothetical protein
LIRSSERLQEFERWYASTQLAQRSYQEALAVYAALWKHARALNPDFPSDWERDVEADIELARVLNGLPRQP